MGKGGKRHSQKQSKDNGEKARDAKPVAAAIIAEVADKVKADHAMGARVKELRDGGMAWWQIAYQLELPGSGPNVAQGKSGAARARALYRKTYGELPGDVAARSTKASRAAAGAEGVALAVRKPQFDEAQCKWKNVAADDDIIRKVAGHEIRWVGHTPCADGTTLSVEREARVYREGITVERRKGKRTTLHFREYVTGHARQAQQWRSVYLEDIYDIRR